MMKTNCERIRLELDEVIPGDDCSLEVAEHLRTCPGCQEFHQKQTKLRQIVGSLGTIEAPADFEFRLRARLAREDGRGVYNLKAAYWSFAQRGFAAVALFVLLVGAVVGVRQFMNPKNAGESRVSLPVTPNVDTPKVQPSEAPNRALENENPEHQRTAAVHQEDDSPKRVTYRIAGNSRPKRAMQSADFSSRGATVIGGPQSVATAETMDGFPISASMQSLTGSIDDGRGNAPTISLPAVSFG